MCLHRDIETQYKDAKDVFIGKVIKVDSSHYDTSGDQLLLYNVQIIRHLKNGSNDYLKTVTFYRDNSSCNFSFSLGKTYLIFTDNNMCGSDLHHTNSCSGNKLIENVDQSILSRFESHHKKIQNDPNKGSGSWVTITEDRYNLFIKQGLLTQKLDNYIIILAIVCMFMFISLCILSILYLKTKKNHANNR